MESAWQASASCLTRVTKSLTPVIFRGGVPDVLLRLANRWRRVDHHEFIVAAEQEITGMKVTMK